MEGAEMVRGEAAHFQERDRQRIADNKLLERRRRRRKAVRAGFRHFRKQEHNVGCPRQGGIGAGRDCDQRDGEAAGIGDDALEFGGFTRPGHGNDGVVARDHSQIAVIGLHRVHEECRCSGRRQRGRDLRADMTALANACHNHPALDSSDQFDGPCKGLGQAVIQGFGQGGNAGLLNRDRAQRRGDRRRVVRLRFKHSHRHDRRA